MSGVEITILVFVIILFIICCVIAGRCSSQANRLKELKLRINEQNKNQHKMYEQHVLFDLNKKFKDKYYFEITGNTLLDRNFKNGQFDIMCWNFAKNECGTLYGTGIDWEKKILYVDKIYFYNTNIKNKETRNSNVICGEFINALSTKNSCNFTAESCFKIIKPVVTIVER